MHIDPGGEARLVQPRAGPGKHMKSRLRGELVEPHRATLTHDGRIGQPCTNPQVPPTRLQTGHAAVSRVEPRQQPETGSQDPASTQQPRQNRGGDRPDRPAQERRYRHDPPGTDAENEVSERRSEGDHGRS